MLNSAWAIAVALSLQTPAPQPPPPEVTWPDDKPITRLVPNLVNDARALPSWDTLFILGGGGAVALMAHSQDDDLAEWAAESGSSASGFGRVLGNGLTQGTIALVGYGIGRVNKDGKTTHVASDLIRAQVLNGLLTQTLKFTINRTRPSGGDHAFPSGHTSATFASATVLQKHLGWKVGVPSYALASFVGWTRIRDRAHWLTDVIFGAALGTVSARTVTLGHHRNGWAVVPVRTNGGVAVYLMKVDRPKSRAR